MSQPEGKPAISLKGLTEDTGALAFQALRA